MEVALAVATGAAVSAVAAAVNDSPELRKSLRAKAAQVRALLVGGLSFSLPTSKNLDSPGVPAPWGCKDRGVPGGSRPGGGFCAACRWSFFFRFNTLAFSYLNLHFWLRVHSLRPPAAAQVPQEQVSGRLLRLLFRSPPVRCRHDEA